MLECKRERVTENINIILIYVILNVTILLKNVTKANMKIILEIDTFEEVKFLFKEIKITLYYVTLYPLFMKHYLIL